MKALLDTHAFLWWITDDARLSKRARGFIADPDNELLLSAASAWEMAIKASLGKLEVAGELVELVTAEMNANAINGLAVTVQHALRVLALPHHHRDPFDRLLVAQCQIEDVPIVSGDAQYRKYGVKRIW